MPQLPFFFLQREFYRLRILFSESREQVASTRWQRRRQTTRRRHQRAQERHRQPPGHPEIPTTGSPWRHRQPTRWKRRGHPTPRRSRRHRPSRQRRWQRERQRSQQRRRRPSHQGQPGSQTQWRRGPPPLRPFPPRPSPQPRPRGRGLFHVVSFAVLYLDLPLYIGKEESVYIQK